MRTYYDSKIEEYGRGMLTEAYNDLTEPEQKNFNIIFKGGIENIDPEKIKTAYDLCVRALSKHKQL